MKFGHGKYPPPVTVKRINALFPITSLHLLIAFAVVRRSRLHEEGDNPSRWWWWVRREYVESRGYVCRIRTRSPRVRVVECRKRQRSIDGCVLSAADSFSFRDRLHVSILFIVIVLSLLSNVCSSCLSLFPPVSLHHACKRTSSYDVKIPHTETPTTPIASCPKIFPQRGSPCAIDAIGNHGKARKSCSNSSSR